MSIRSIFLFLGLGLAVAGCTATSVDAAYTTPGWYLEQPRQLFMTSPAYLAGPFAYEQCEVERLKTPRPDRLLCTNWEDQAVRKLTSLVSRSPSGWHCRRLPRC